MYVVLAEWYICSKNQGFLISLQWPAGARQTCFWSLAEGPDLQHAFPTEVEDKIPCKAKIKLGTHTVEQQQMNVKTETYLAIPTSYLAVSPSCSLCPFHLTLSQSSISLPIGMKVTYTISIPIVSETVRKLKMIFHCLPSSWS